MARRGFEFERKLKLDRSRACLWGEIATRKKFQRIPDFIHSRLPLFALSFSVWLVCRVVSTSFFTSSWTISAAELASGFGSAVVHIHSNPRVVDAWVVVVAA